MLEKLQKHFRSVIKSLEVLYVMEGAKPSARVLCHEDNLEATLKFLEENKIKAEVSDFKVVKENTVSSFYSDKSVMIDRGSKTKGHLILYASKDEVLAKSAKKFEKEQNHKQLGLALGYPECCCDFFEKNFSEAKTDLTLESLKNSDGMKFPFLNNIAARDFDISLLSHFPHSFQCKESEKIADNYLKILEKTNKNIAKSFADTLKCGVLYTETDGVFLLRNYKYEQEDFSFGSAVGTKINRIYRLLASGRKVKVFGKNSVEINEIKIEGNDIGFMIFG